MLAPRPFYDVLTKEVYPIQYNFEATGEQQFSLYKEVYFAPDSYINKNMVYAIHCVTNSEISKSIVGDQPKDLLPYSVLAGGYIILRSDKETILTTISLTSLTLPANNGKLFLFGNLKIDWSSCSFVFNDSGVTDANCLLFNIYLNK